MYPFPYIKPKTNYNIARRKHWVKQACGLELGKFLTYNTKSKTHRRTSTKPNYIKYEVLVFSLTGSSVSLLAFVLKLLKFFFLCLEARHACNDCNGLIWIPEPDSALENSGVFSPFLCFFFFFFEEGGFLLSVLFLKNKTKY